MNNHLNSHGLHIVGYISNTSLYRTMSDIVIWMLWSAGIMMSSASWFEKTCVYVELSTICVPCYVRIYKLGCELYNLL